MKVILIVVECLRSDHLSCYGYERETTPFLDSVVLSKQGLMWADFKATGCETKTTFELIAKYIKAISKNQIHTSFYSGNAGPAGARMEASVVDFKSWPAWHCHRPPRKAGQPTSSEMIKAFIKAHAGRDSYFGVLHLQETHAKYQHWGQAERFIGDELWEQHKRIWGKMALDGKSTIDTCASLQSWDGADSQVWRQKGSRFDGMRVANHPACYIAAYDGATRLVDSCLPELFAALPDAEIFVTGDHGEGLGDKGRAFCTHAYGMFPELTRVPCIVRTPMPIAQETRVMAEKCNHRHMLNTILSHFKIKPRGPLLPWPSADPEVLRRLEGLGYVGRK